MRIILQTLICQVILAVSLPNPTPRPGASWETNCPSECTCYMTSLSDATLDAEDDTDRPEYNTKEDTQVTETPRPEKGLQLKAIACIVSKRTKLRGLFSGLPVDTQMLTLMQSHDSQNITLGRDHFSHLENLRSLTIQGSRRHKTQEQGTLHVGAEENRPTFIIEWDAFLSLPSIEFIDIEHAEIETAPDDVDIDKLISKKRKKNKRKREAVEDDNLFVLEEDTTNKKVFVEEGGPVTIVHELVFLPGEEDSSKIVPYEVYKAEKANQNSLESFFFLKNLKTLRLNHCKIPPLSANTFSGLENLLHVSIKKCDLKILPDLLFAKATNVETLILAHNNIMDLNSEAFAGLFELQHLDLSFNNLTHISETSFAPMPSLQFINLRGNSLRVYPSTFEVMNATRRIYLGDPHDEEVTVDIIPGAFKGLRYLHHLSIHGLRAPHLDSDILRGTKALNELVIKGQVHELSFDAFIHNPKLRKLDLSHSQIRDISVDSFQHLYGLQVLDLSHNELEELPPGVFDNLQSLKELWLNDNHLQELPENIFRNLHSKLIRLDENPWHCTCDLKQLNSAVVNKVRSTKHPIVCDKAYDKPSLCHSAHILKYKYDRLVAPRCKTPVRFEHWSVFDVLRKELRCEHRHGITPQTNTVSLNYLNLKQLMKNFEKYATAHNDDDETVQVPVTAESEEDEDGGELIEDDEFYQPTHDETFFDFNTGEHPFAHLKDTANSFIKSKLTMHRKLTPYDMENETILKEDLKYAMEKKVDEIVEALQKAYDAQTEEKDIKDEAVEIVKEPEPEALLESKVLHESMEQENRIPQMTNDISTTDFRKADEEQTKVIANEDNEIPNDLASILPKANFAEPRQIHKKALPLEEDVEELNQPIISNSVETEKRRTPIELLQDKEYTSSMSKKALKLLMEKARAFEKEKKMKS